MTASTPASRSISTSESESGVTLPTLYIRTPSVTMQPQLHMHGLMTVYKFVCSFMFHGGVVCYVLYRPISLRCRVGARLGDSVASVNVTFFSSHDLRLCGTDISRTRNRFDSPFGFVQRAQCRRCTNGSSRLSKSD